LARVAPNSHRSLEAWNQIQKTKLHCLRPFNGLNALTLAQSAIPQNLRSEILLALINQNHTLEVLIAPLTPNLIDLESLKRKMVLENQLHLVNATHLQSIPLKAKWNKIYPL
jgi:hypothetical protein